MNADQRTRHIANAKRSLKETRRRKVVLRKMRIERLTERKGLKEQLRGMQALYDAGFTDQQIAELFAGNRKQEAEDRVRENYNSTYVTPETSEDEIVDAEYVETEEEE